MSARKVAIVTGSSSGIGLATVQLLLSTNHSVYGVDISAAPDSLSSSAHFKSAQLDLTQDGAAEQVVEAALAAFTGRIDALLNVAGIADTFQSVDTLDDDIWARMLAVNLTAPARLMRAAVRVMLKQERDAVGARGVVVNVASKAALSGSVSGVAYTASKHGLVGVTKQTAFRYRLDGIRCNAICPGAVHTNIGLSMDQKRMDMATFMNCKPYMDATQQMDPMAKPEEMASMIAYLVSDGSIAVNGSIIPVDNAWSTT